MNAIHKLIQTRFDSYDLNRKIQNRINDDGDYRWAVDYDDDIIDTHDEHNKFKLKEKKSYLANSLIGIFAGLAVFGVLLSVVFLARWIRNKRLEKVAASGEAGDSGVRYARHTDEAEVIAGTNESDTQV